MRSLREVLPAVMLGAAGLVGPAPETIASGTRYEFAGGGVSLPAGSSFTFTVNGDGRLVGANKVVTGTAYGPAKAGSVARPGYLRPGDRIVFLGDSITEQRMYTNFAETYLALRYPGMKLSFANAGWGGDTTAGALKRLERDVLSLKPTVVTICYGMNDGGYGYAKPEDAAAAFGKNLREIVKRLKARKVRVVILTNGVVDDSLPKMKWLRDVGDYNAGGLKALKEEALRVATEEGLSSFDLHAEMTDVLARAKKDGVGMGDDGIHPDEGGSLIMAFCLLKALGVPPRHESFRVDLSAKGAKPARAPVVKREIGSWRLSVKLDGLPYAVEGKARKMLPYLPFNEEFNDIRLAFTGLPDGSYYVKLDGALTPVLSREELEKGLPLASLWGIGPMAAAAKVAGVTREKNNLYRQFWRAVSLPDDYAVGANYDPKPHMLGVKIAGEIEAYRRSLIKPPVMAVEVIRVDRAPVPLKAGDAITRWRMASGFSVRPPKGDAKEAKKGEAAKVTDPSLPLPSDWAEAVLDGPDTATNLKCAYHDGGLWGIRALAVLESDAAQEAVLTIEGHEDFLAYLNGRDGPWVQEDAKSRDVKLSLVAGRNVLLLVIWNDKRAVNGFRAVLKSAVSPIRQAF